MIRTLSILFTLFLFLSCSSTKTTAGKDSVNAQSEKPVLLDFAGELSAEQLSFVRTAYHWESDEVLIINYSQPIANCHFDNNQINNASERWWNDFYSKVNTENCRIIKVLSNGERVRGKLDEEYYFDDKNDFLFENFFNRKQSCYGVLVINTRGEYLQYNGHYSEKQVEKYIEALKKPV